MGRKKMVKLELTNPRYSRLELRDHAAEFIPYARYAGYMLVNFNAHLSSSKVHPLKPEIAERNHRLNIETTMENAKILSQIIRIYPSFNTWKLRVLATDVTPTRSKAKTAKKESSKTAVAASGKTKKSAKSTKTAKTVKSRKIAKTKTTVKKSVKKKASKKVVKKQAKKR